MSYRICAPASSSDLGTSAALLRPDRYSHSESESALPSAKEVAPERAVRDLQPGLPVVGRCIYEAFFRKAPPHVPSAISPRTQHDDRFAHAARPLDQDALAIGRIGQSESRSGGVQLGSEFCHGCNRPAEKFLVGAGLSVFKIRRRLLRLSGIHKSGQRLPTRSGSCRCPLSLSQKTLTMMRA